MHTTSMWTIITGFITWGDRAADDVAFVGDFPYFCLSGMTVKTEGILLLAYTPLFAPLELPLS